MLEGEMRGILALLWGICGMGLETSLRSLRHRGSLCNWAIARGFFLLLVGELLLEIPEGGIGAGREEFEKSWWEE